MLLIKLVILSLCLVSCSYSNKETSIPNANFSIRGVNFVESKSENPLFITAVESSIVSYNNQITYLIDFGMNGDLSVGTNKADMVSVSKDDRFAYIFQKENIYYKLHTVSSNVYLTRSYDLKSWSLMNNGQPVLSQQLGTIYSTIWNVGVDIDSQGVWHLLAEVSATGNENACLAYSTATLNGNNISFDLNKSMNCSISKAGNPWVGYVEGKGLLTVYGKMNEQDLWFVKAAVLTDGSWVENESIEIGEAGVHICDPHLLQTESGLILTLSYAQEYVFKLETKDNLEQLFNQVKGGL